MNYRHAYHAGNFADCMKHALLCWMLESLTRKPAPFLVMDTHAGTGHTDLNGEEAQRTGEWHGGIGTLLDHPPEALRPYVELVENLGLYPGSPRLIRALMRLDDRLVVCEQHPDDCQTLRRRFRHDKQVAVHQRDAYEAMRALLPSAPKRGLVLIDPPFEQGGEFERIVQALRTGCAQFPGIFAVWYPIKGRAPVRAFHQSVQGSGVPDVVVAELYLREPTDPTRLNGCGLLVRHAPYGFMEAAPVLLDALLERMGMREPGEGTMVGRLTDE
jgi:23S rRNA (adenine2030-N6)-methyltransferase